MVKQTEIKFRDCGGFLEGRRRNLTFAIYDDNLWKDPKKKTCFVVVRHKDIESPGFNTAEHRHFTLEGVKEFCQKIATGEIDPAAMLAEFAAEDMAREQAAIRDVTERAKKFHCKLQQGMNPPPETVTISGGVVATAGLEPATSRL